MTDVMTPVRSDIAMGVLSEAVKTAMVMPLRSAVVVAAVHRMFGMTVTDAMAAIRSAFAMAVLSEVVNTAMVMPVLSVAVVAGAHRMLGMAVTDAMARMPGIRMESAMAAMSATMAMAAMVAVRQMSGILLRNTKGVLTGSAMTAIIAVAVEDMAIGKFG